MIKFKDEEINGYKEKVKALLATITVKNDYLNKSHSDFYYIAFDIDSKYFSNHNFHFANLYKSHSNHNYYIY